VVGALGRHLALAGFMGAGKTTVGMRVAELTHRPFVDLDAEIEARHGPIPELFERSEPEFRRLEETIRFLEQIYSRPISEDDVATVIRFSQIVGTMF